MQVLCSSPPPVHGGLLRNLTIDATGENKVTDDSRANVRNLVDERLKQVWLWPEFVDPIEGVRIEALRVEQTFDSAVAYYPAANRFADNASMQIAKGASSRQFVRDQCGRNR